MWTKDKRMFLEKNKTTLLLSNLRVADPVCDYSPLEFRWVSFPLEVEGFYLEKTLPKL